MTPFGECAVLDDGRRVITPWLGRGIALDGVPHEGPVLRMPDAALTPSGKIWVVGKHQEDVRASVWLSSVGKWWDVPHLVYGSRMILRADGERCRIAFATSATTWLCLKVEPTGEMAIVTSGTIPSGEGAQGMRGWNPLGAPRPLAPLDEPLEGHTVRSIVSSGGTTIACALGPLPDQVLLFKGGVLGTLQRPGIDWPTVRLSANGQYWCGVRYVGESVFGGPVPAVVPPLQTDGVPSDPPEENVLNAPGVEILSFEPIDADHTCHLVRFRNRNNPEHGTFEVELDAGYVRASIRNEKGFDRSSRKDRKVI